MARRSPASRQRFLEYKQRLAQRRAGGEFNAASSPHSTRPPGTPKHRTFGQLLRRFAQLVSDERRAIAFALATVTLSTLLKLIPPASAKITIDYVLDERGRPADLAGHFPAWLHVPTDRYQLLIAMAVAVVVISVFESIVHLWGRWFATASAKRIQAQTRKRVFEHAVRLPLHRIYQIKSGGVASILRDDAGGIAELIFTMVYNPWRAAVQLLGSLVILAWVDWRLLVGALALLPTVFLTHRTWINRIRPLYRDIRVQRQDIDSHATEVFGGMRIVRAFARTKSETGRFLRGTHLMARQELNAWWWARSVELLWEVILPLASAGLLLYGGMQILHGELTVGDLMMFLAYLAMLLGPLAVLANSATQFQSDLAGLDRVLDVLDEPIEMPPLPGAIALDAGQVAGRITLRDVSFHYPSSDELVLKNIDLDVQPGELIAFVGPSGAGKTTLCNLIARFFDPTAGTITLDGLDLRKIQLESFRRLLGVVEQDIFLFDGTVADNIGYAERTASADAIREAAELANADEFIRALPQGYDTVIGERGVRLSGGQRQRLAIARAVLANPRVLILDEATSNLDTESERLIQQSLDTLFQGRTSFVIAHRLSTIVHADRIVVLDHGGILEQGTHDELMSRSGQYRRMVDLQMGTAHAM